MARTNEEALRVLSRRAKVARLVLTGVTNQYEIAERLGLDRIKGQPTVSRDLAAIKAEWKLAAVQALDEAKGREIARLEAVEAELWAAWERSKEERQSTRTRRRAGGQQMTDEAEVSREKRDGNPKFLDAILRCIELRCRILGILQQEAIGSTTVVTVVGGVDLQAVTGQKPGLAHDRIGTGPN
jgi:hypothetical protein